MTDPGQTYCNWCYLTLTEDDHARSRASGFDTTQTWACVRCITIDRIFDAPGGLNGPWPVSSSSPTAG